MKIDFIGPHLKISGGNRALYKYASLLSEKGHDVALHVESLNVFRRTAANVLNPHGPEWMQPFPGRVHRVRSFSELAGGEALVVSSLRYADEIRHLLSRYNKNILLLQHEEGLYHVPREQAERVYAMRYDFIVISSWLQDELRQRGVSTKLLVTPVDHGQFHPVQRTAPDNHVRILLLDHIYDWKGTKEGIEIIHSLKTKYPNISLVMFGVRRKEIPWECDEYHFNPAQRELAKIYSGCDIYLCPSWDEGLGMPSMEAMACRVALATYDNGGSRNYAFDGKTAVVAPRLNSRVLSEKLEQLVVDRKFRVRIAHAGYNYIASMPSWKEQVERLESILMRYV